MLKSKDLLSVMLKSYDKIFDQQLRDLLSTIFAEGFYVTLVGGGVRDFIIKNALSWDLDFEIRTEQNLSGDEWLAKLKRLQEVLQEADYQVKALPYQVMRISIGEKEIELASPRVESFNDSDNSHKNFQAEFFANLDYKEAFVRRDFSINAIGVEIRSEDDLRIVDPFDGLKDVDDKILRHCGPDFFKDPVRLLRAIRFSITTGFTFDKQLSEQWGKFSLNEISNYHIVYESVHSADVLQFFKKMFGLIDENNIIVNFKMGALRFFTKLDHNDDYLLDSVDNVTLFLAAKVNMVGEDKLLRFAELYGIKKNLILHFRSYLLCLEQFDDEMLEKVEHASRYDVLNDPGVEICQIFYDLSKKMTFKLPLEELLEKLYPTQSHYMSQLGLDEDLLGAEIFAEENENISQEERKMYRMICHFKGLYGGVDED